MAAADATTGDVVVVGGGVAGLAAALGLARQGRAVTVLERDATPLPAGPEEAFGWDRRGAPQVRHSHAFLARLHSLLRDHYPDVLDALLAAGATEQRFGQHLPPTMVGFAPEPGDEDLVMLCCRRTTFEWVLRRAVLAEGRVELRTGTAVRGLLAAGDADAGEAVRVAGVRLDSGADLPAALTVVATGRRSALPAWLSELGAPTMPEEEDDTGIVYLSRFYRLREAAPRPAQGAAVGGDLGYLKYGVFAGDNRTFSITLAVPVADEELRRLLGAPPAFDATARSLAPAADWLAGSPEPITEVHVMAGLVNRWRDLVVGGRPLALGLHAVGDAQVCTNPALRARLHDRLLACPSHGRSGPRPPRRSCSRRRWRSTPRRVSTSCRGTARQSVRTLRPGGSPRRCWPGRTRMPISRIPGPSCAPCSGTVCSLPCAATRWC